jgi:hypothetical protein
MYRLLIFCCLLALATAWSCKFKIDGYEYDISGSKGKNSSDDLGNFFNFDNGNVNGYYFKLCEATDVTPSGAPGCDNPSPTQVCQQPGSGIDKSCGINPVPRSLSGKSSKGEGFTLYSSGGTLGCRDQGTGEERPRETNLNVICTDKAPFFSGAVLETDPPGCIYTINFYHEYGCGKGGGLSGGSVFLIIFFVGLFVYFAAGVGWNAYNGAEGIELIPQVEFWKDLPFLCKDGVMFLVGLATGGGSYSTVE